MQKRRRSDGRCSWKLALSLVLKFIDSLDETTVEQGGDAQSRRQIRMIEKKTEDRDEAGEQGALQELFGDACPFIIAADGRGVRASQLW